MLFFQPDKEHRPQADSCENTLPTDDHDHDDHPHPRP
jgi:hypothetical protein